MQRSTLFGGALLAVAGLYLAARTPRGTDALEFVTVTARRIADAALPKGIRNNNPGNLRFIARNPWDGQIGQDADGFGIYESMALGVRAAGRQLLSYQRAGRDTVREIISTWAPASENDTAAYVAQVAKALNVAADQRIDARIVLEDLAAAIFRHENGGLFTLAIGDISQWVRL